MLCSRQDTFKLAYIHKMGSIHTFSFVELIIYIMNKWQYL
jgi:hypothetical protein